MASSASEEAGTGKSLEGVSKGQSSDTLAERRYCEQVENGTRSTSPPHWDSDDDDDGGPKPSDLYGKYTWKIDKYSQINKRELQSNAFEIGGYKWYHIFGKNYFVKYTCAAGSMISSFKCLEGDTE